MNCHFFTVFGIFDTSSSIRVTKATTMNIEQEFLAIDLNVALTTT